MDQLLQPNERASLRDDEVLNGIAYDPVHEIFYVTGKDWPAFFQVRLEP
jgi:glutamine cyclotransferase